MTNDHCKTGFIWSPLLERFDFGRLHPIRVGRFQMIHDFLREAGFLSQPNVRIVEPKPLPLELLAKIHSKDYISRVKKMSETGEGEISIDTPGFKGIYDTARISTGGTISGIRAILRGEIEHVLSPTGGFHHAHYDGGGGFCVFNDLAASVQYLRGNGIQRIMIADFDVHHGNGTQRYFMSDPDVMIISFHEDPEWLYPHDGHIKDIGLGEGLGYNINMHFPMDSGNNVYKYAFDELVPPLIEKFQPEFILFLPGYDAHYMDRLAHLNLTTDMIAYVAEFIHNASHRYSNGQLCVLSGGGYHPDALCWGVGVVMSILTGHDYIPPSQQPPFDDDDDIWAIVRENVLEVKQLIFPKFGIDMNEIEL